MITNTGKSALTVEDVSDSGCGGGLDPWGTSPYAYPYSVPKKGHLVFSSTTSGNFDGSEICGTDTTVSVLINGVKASYPDAIANSGGGAIHGSPGTRPFGDESTPWTKISPGKSKVQVMPAKLRPGKVGESYRQELFADGTDGAMTFSAASLPPGMSLSSSGELSGVPTGPGKVKFTVHVTDTATPTDNGKKTFTFVVKP